MTEAGAALTILGLLVICAGGPAVILIVGVILLGIGLSKR